MNERPPEYAFVFKMISKHHPGRILDVGTGKTALPALIHACDIDVDAIDDDQSQIRNNRHWTVRKANVLTYDSKVHIDMVTCISVLEHISNYEEAVTAMAKLLGKGGVLVLTFPYNEESFVENAYELSDAGYGKGSGLLCRIYNRVTVSQMLSRAGLSLSDQEYWRVFTDDLWTMGHRHAPQESSKNRPHHLTCISAVKDV